MFGVFRWDPLSPHVGQLYNREQLIRLSPPSFFLPSVSTLLILKQNQKKCTMQKTYFHFSNPFD